MAGHGYPGNRSGQWGHSGSRSATGNRSSLAVRVQCPICGWMTVRVYRVDSETAYGDCIKCAVVVQLVPAPAPHQAIRLARAKKELGE